MFLQLQSKHPGKGAAEIRPGDVRAAVPERDGAVVGAGERREDERYGQDLQEVEVPAGELEPVAGEAVGTARLLNAELSELGDAARFKESVVVRAGLC